MPQTHEHMEIIDGSRSSIQAAFSHKDIEDVMARSVDLVRPTTRLRPLRVVTG